MGAVVAKLVFKSGKDKFSTSHESLLDIGATDIDGNRIEKLGSILKGKRCTLVSNLYKEYRDQGFEILTFPCNQFGGQEPGTNQEVKQFIRELYGGEWPIFEKSDVNGENSNEVFKYLRYNSELNDKEKKEVKEIPWNFAKFLVNEDGEVVAYFGPRVEPITMVKDIEALLYQGC
ncbi:glutathione peroxidase family protein [Stylonychia lemnae]|uniref:Glutathione peroxidase n=1 Tax=Stylonychia lemnae TaxID=5949 RepID=A0A078B637_STYLE|nr:glutathione peroxidase family protein [Stylonychia lemnae]|eukprot:CDW89686.1 glutathione peroxidase family protein [Stylonychia lemnae]